MPQPTTAIYFSESFPAAPDGNQLCLPRTDNAVPEQSVTFFPQLATTALAGVVKPDGSSVTIDPDGTIHAPNAGGGTGGASASSGQYICVVPTPDPTDGTGTQFILPAPVLAGTVGLAFVNGVLLDPLTADAEYAVQGTQLTTKYPVKSDDKLRYYYIMGTPNSEAGGGGSVTPTSLRGTTSISVNSATITVPLPAGAQAGDLAILFLAHAYWLATPSGWTGLDTVYAIGRVWNGLAASKVLSSGDITAGGVSVTATGSSYGMGAMAVFAGAGGGVRESEGNAGAVSGTGTDTLSTSSAVLNTDMGIYFGSAANGANPTVSLSPGSNLESPSNSYATGAMAIQLMPGGVTAQNFTYSDASIGFVHFIVIVEG